MHGADAFARALADARAAAEAQRAVWIMLLLDDLDAWIASQKVRPTRPQAIRQLVAKALYKPRVK